MPSRLIGAPTSAISTIFMQDALPYTTLPIYPGLGQAPNMLACDLNFIVKGEGLLKVTCSHVHCKSGDISKMVTEML